MGARILARLTTEPWETTRESLEQMIRIAERVNPSIDELEAKLGKRLEGTRRALVREGVTIIPIEGPIFRKAMWFQEISGAASTDIISRDFNAALADEAVKAILFSVDSPGGEATALSELSEMIYRARGRKPIVAYVEGMGASAAYHIISAADSIVAGPQALVGSIGAIISMAKVDESKKYTFVASQSPRKRLDPSSDEGAADIQQIVDDVAAVFVADVARNRGIDVDRVLSGYGAGGLMIASRALEAGMIDRVGMFEDVLAELAKTPAPTSWTDRAGVTGVGIFSDAGNAGAIHSADDTPPANEVTPMAEEKRQTITEYLAGLAGFSRDDRKKVKQAVEMIDGNEGGAAAPPAAVSSAPSSEHSSALAESERRRIEAERKVYQVQGDGYARELVSAKKISPAQGERIGFVFAELAALDEASPLEKGQASRVDRFREIFGSVAPADISKEVAVGASATVLANARASEGSEEEAIAADRAAVRTQFGAPPVATK